MADAADEIINGTLDLIYLEHRLRDQIIQVPKGNKFESRVEHHVDAILMGNDLLTGGDGNDLIIGDDLVVRTPLVTVTPGGSVPHENDGHDEWRDAERWNERGRQASLELDAQ